MAGSIHEYRVAGLAAEYHNNSNGLFYRMPFTLESVAQTNSALRLEFKWHTPDHRGKGNKMLSSPSFWCLEQATFEANGITLNFI